jgi:two-component system OmpR family sensor kinase
LVIQAPLNSLWAKSVVKTLGFYGSILFLFMMGLGYFLVRIILTPMRDAIELLDRFIKDTTHELNTPVTTILSNIEMMDKTQFDEKLLKKIQRIDIGARTISNLYEDLTYLTLSHKIISHNETVDLKALIEERVLYFSLFAESRKIVISTDLNENIILHVDRKKIAKLIDNLLSNAIKYNKINGTIKIVLEKGFFELTDSGRGIAKEKIDTMFRRYARADTSVGGFGIGLSIVSMIAKEYKLDIQISSELNEWTKVRVLW